MSTAVAIKATATTHASRRERSPAAIGRNRLVGCAVSRTRSLTSLRKYIALDARQKATKAIAAFARAAGWRRTPAVAGAAKTRVFLIHCRGLAVATRDRIKAR
jgi:hypothetical protein